MRPVLYDSSHADYYKKDVKKTAMDQIVDNLSGKGVLVTVGDISAKMQSMKTYYCKERGKVSTSRGTGTGTDDIYKSKWRFYPKMDFLGDSFTPRHTVSSRTSAESLQTPSRRGGKGGKGGKRGAQEDHLERLTGYMGEIASSCQQTQPIAPAPTVVEKSDDDVWGELLVRKMKKLQDGFAKENLKIKILTLVNNAVFEIDED